MISSPKIRRSPYELSVLDSMFVLKLLNYVQIVKVHLTLRPLIFIHCSFLTFIAISKMLDLPTEGHRNCTLMSPLRCLTFEINLNIYLIRIAICF